MKFFLTHNTYTQWILFTSREYLADGAINAVNVDAQVADTVKHNVVTNPSRYAFDTAEVGDYQLIKI